MFIREKALVVHLDALRMIICADQVLLLSVPNAEKKSQAVFPTVDNPFVRDLASRLAACAARDSDNPNSHRHPHIDGSLPYELLALECALAAFVRGMEEETTELEMRAATSLESLTAKVTKRELETVRSCKVLLNRQMGRASQSAGQCLKPYWTMTTTWTACTWVGEPSRKPCKRSWGYRGGSGERHRHGGCRQGKFSEIAITDIVKVDKRQGTVPLTFTGTTEYAPRWPVYLQKVVFPDAIQMALEGSGALRGRGTPLLVISRRATVDMDAVPNPAGPSEIQTVVWQHGAGDDQPA
eukprot:jgi/Botrbrau1/11745/Bobra.0195s0071.2